MDAVFKLKASLFTLTVAQIFTTDLADIERRLSDLKNQTPAFFKGMPIILDLTTLTTSIHAEQLRMIIECCHRYGLHPIAARTISSLHDAIAKQMQLAIIPMNQATSNFNHKQLAKNTHAKLITQPVRSGQQIYARHTDLIVLSCASPGSELLADGHIHVYGRLQGRALAGVTGNEQASIFCRNLEAELVSVAGHYWLSEDLEQHPIKDHVHIYLDQGRLQLRTV